MTYTTTDFLRHVRTESWNRYRKFVTQPRLTLDADNDLLQVEFSVSLDDTDRNLTTVSVENLPIQMGNSEMWVNVTEEQLAGLFKQIEIVGFEGRVSWDREPTPMADMQRELDRIRSNGG